MPVGRRCTGADCIAVLHPETKGDLCRRCRGKKLCAERAATDQKRVLTDSTVASGNVAEITRISDQKVRTLADLVRVCEIDTTEWEVERYVCNKWEVGAKDKAGDLVTKPLFQVKAWVRRKVVQIAARAEIAAMLADAKKAIPPRMPIARAVKGKHLLEIAIPDLHVGKLAWGKETGGENYDIRIAVDRFNEALDTLIARTASFGFERVLFVVGNDLLNANNTANTTARGTPQDADGRFQKAFLSVRRMLTAGIDRMRRVAPVTVLVVPGNHDTDAAYFIGDSLECWFHRTPDVEVRNEPTTRKYYRFGKVMLMFTHGDKGKRQDYPLLMATEQPEMFGATIHREAHTGHMHMLRVQEHHGVKVRISPALCEADAWHAENMYTGNARGAEAFVYHPEDGLVAIANYTVPRRAADRNAA